MIRVTIESGIAIIAFDNPPQGYLDLPQVERITAALTRIEADPAVQVLILTGALPDVFIRHYDIKEEAEFAERLKRSSRSDEDINRIARGDNAVSICFGMLEKLNRPTIAAINGYCQGGGLELALCCDFRIAAEGTYCIGLPEVHIGIVPGGGGTYRLTRLLGHARALDLILRGRALNPSEALEAGLVNEVVQNALERSMDLARELKSVPRAALLAAKELVRTAVGDTGEAALARERVAFSFLLRNQPEAADLCNAFITHDGDINDFIASRRPAGLDQ